MQQIIVQSITEKADIQGHDGPAYVLKDSRDTDYFTFDARVRDLPAGTRLRIWTTGQLNKILKWEIANPSPPSPHPPFNAAEFNRQAALRHLGTLAIQEIGLAIRAGAWLESTRCEKYWQAIDRGLDFLLQDAAPPNTDGMAQELAKAVKRATNDR